MPDLISAQELPLQELSRDETTNPASHPSRPSRLPRPSQPRPSNAHVNPFLDMPEDDAPLSSFKLGQVGRTPAANNLINLDRPSSSQDAEIREVVFNLPPTPLRSVSPSSPADTTPRPGSTSHLPDHLSVHEQNDERANEGGNRLPSTTFSFLSLSQASSPEVSNAALAQMSLSVASATEPWGEMSDFAPLSPAPAPRNREMSATSADVWARIEVPTLTANNLVRLAQGDGRGHDHTRDTRDEDVLSLAETSTSGYIDAESYTPGMLSPMRIHTAWSSPAGLPVSNDLLTERNLRAVDNIPPVSLGPIARARPGKGQIERREPTNEVKKPRGTMSVVSLSESEGWGGDSDWEGRSEAGMRQ